MDQKVQNHDVLRRVHEIRVEIGKLTMDRAMGKLNDTNAIYKKRKEIARLLSGATTVQSALVQKEVKAEESKEKKTKKVKKEDK